MLKRALAQARKRGLVSFNKILDIFSTRRDEINQKVFIEAMKIAITLESLDAVKRLLAICPSDSLSNLSKAQMHELSELAAGYENSAAIIRYLNVNWQDNNKEEQSKRQFHKLYDRQLQKDKGSCFGFFTISHVNKGMSIKELVQHAQGLSGKGSGERSQAVMRKLGWLDQNNEATAAISSYLS